MKSLDDMKTMTGIAASMIREALNQQYPEDAYDPIRLSGGRIGADVPFEHVRQRVDGVFGPAGIGWRLVADPVSGKAHVAAEERPTYDYKSGEQTGVQVWFVADLLNYRFEYCLLDEAGCPVWFTACTVSDSDDNMDRGYALRGVWTSAFKQAVRVQGGFDHIYAGDVDLIVRRKQKERDDKKGERRGRQNQDRAGSDDGKNTAASGDSFKAGGVVTEFIKSWVEKGIKPPKILEILGVKSLAEYEAGRAAADATLTQWMANQAQPEAVQ